MSDCKFYTSLPSPQDANNITKALLASLTATPTEDEEEFEETESTVNCFDLVFPNLTCHNSSSGVLTTSLRSFTTSSPSDINLVPTQTHQLHFTVLQVMPYVSRPHHGRTTYTTTTSAESTTLPAELSPTVLVGVAMAGPVMLLLLVMIGGVAFYWRARRERARRKSGPSPPTQHQPHAIDEQVARL